MLSGRLRFPRTRRGWVTLGWLTLRRCPQCHGALSQDWPQYDDGVTLYCFPCGGAMLPNGIIRALEWNARAWAREQQEKNLPTEGQHT